MDQHNHILLEAIDSNRNGRDDRNQEGVSELRRPGVLRDHTGGMGHLSRL